jgi:hypothetical protein
MTQGVLSFKYDEEKKNFGTTSLAGSLIFLDLLHKMGFKNMVENNLSAKEGKQGWSDYCFLVSVILLNLCGGDCVNDINGLEGDTGLRRIFKNLGLKNGFGRGSRSGRHGRHGRHGRRRQKLSRQQWPNGEKNTFPSPTSIFRYLDLFHDQSEEEHRLQNKAFIPLPNENLLGLRDINKDMLEFLQLNNPEKVATIDMDATITRSQKRQAQYSYKSYKGYQPLNAYWGEQGCMVYTEFRDGNVPAGFQQKRVFSEALSCLPSGVSGVEKVYLRSDTAGYQHELLQYCERGENKRFGRIEFAISCDVSPEFKRVVFKVCEAEWHPIYREVNGQKEETGQQWAEVPFVPNAICHSKKGRSYRYIGIREAFAQRQSCDMELQASLPFPTMELNNKSYKIFGLVTNMDWDGEELVHWSRKRCGYSEHVHSEMKEALCGGQLPSGKFGCNAAWWWMMILSLNLTAIMKKLALPGKWEGSRMKKIRFWLINIPGRVILEGKELIVRLTRDHPGMELLVHVRRQINRLDAIESG